MGRKETEERYIEKDIPSHKHNMSEVIYHDDELETTDKRRAHKSKTSMGKVSNPYIAHLRRCSLAADTTHQRKVSQPMDQRYFKKRTK